MPRILKYNYINLDNDKVTIEAPVFTSNVSLDDFENNIDNAEFIEETESLSEDDSKENVELSANDVLEIAKMQADEIIKDATDEMERKAEEYKNESRLKAEEEAKEIYKNAEKNGYDDGYNKAMEETNSLKAEAEKLLEEAKKQKEEILENIEPQVVELTVSIINKILNDVKAINPQIIFALIRKGLSETKMTGNIFIHISEKEYDEVIESKEQIPELNDPNVTIEIVKDYGLKSGDCILETAFGNIDCSLDSQFKKVKESLYFILDNNR